MVFQLWNCGAHIDIGDLLDIGGLIDRRKQPAALQIVGDDLRHAVADLVIAPEPATKFGIAIGSGVNSPSGIDDASAPGRRHCGRPSACGAGHSGDDLPAAQGNSMFGNPSLSVIASTLSMIGNRSPYDRHSGLSNREYGAKYFHSSKYAAGRLYGWH